MAATVMGGNTKISQLTPLYRLNIDKLKAVEVKNIQLKDNKVQIFLKKQKEKYKSLSDFQKVELLLQYLNIPEEISHELSNKYNYSSTTVTNAMLVQLEKIAYGRSQKLCTNEEVIQQFTQAEFSCNEGSLQNLMLINQNLFSPPDIANLLMRQKRVVQNNI